jgi:hypothetical protein
MRLARDLAQKPGAAEVVRDHPRHAAAYSSARILGHEVGDRVGHGLDHPLGHLDPEGAGLRRGERGKEDQRGERQEPGERAAERVHHRKLILAGLKVISTSRHWS